MERESNLTNRQKKALETRQLLFDTTLQLILEHGFENVKIDDITSKAGTSVGSFYTYFRSKDQVVVEHYKKIDNHYLDVYQNVDKNLSFTDKLITVLKGGFTYSENLGKEIVRIVLMNQFGQTEDIPYLMNSNRNIFKIVHEIIEEGQKNGEFRNDFQVKEIASMILKLYAGNFYEWCLMKESTNLAENGEKVLRLFIEGALKA